LNYNHFVSKEIVDHAFKNRVGTIKIQMLGGIGEAVSDKRVLRNWSYFELQSLIDFKAKRHGIKTMKVDPKPVCSNCGHFAAKDIGDETFECKACGTKMNYDENEALNIAKSNDIVKKKD